MSEKLASFRFGTKSETLNSLRPLIRTANLCPQISFTLSDWEGSSNSIIKNILDEFLPNKLAVRSSSLNEDTMHSSMAGHFTSVINVTPTYSALNDAIIQVISSYNSDGMNHEVLVQPMVSDVALSGVILSRDLNTGGPYYVINYDDYSGRTDTVTGGSVSKCVAVRRSKPQALQSTRMRALVESVAEIEKITGLECLDVEFCMTKKQKLFILQVRPLAASNSWQNISDMEIELEIDQIREGLQSKMQLVDGIIGRTTSFGEMTDWNPAEMIGNSPKPLALSLYKGLITDKTWSDGRAEMGYRDVGLPLLKSFAGHPFIDIRLSLNSFLPANTNEKFANDLINYQISQLKKFPENHDKIEFEIAYTCLDLETANRLHNLTNHGFSKTDIEVFLENLRQLTVQALGDGEPSLRKIFKRTAALESADSLSNLPPVARAQKLYSSCAANGTLPFSILARHGFIAVSMLRSIVSQGVISNSDAEAFMGGLNTVATDIIRELNLAMSGAIDFETFLKKYGHLRPGTYDITSWRYDEKPDLYIGERIPPVPQLASGRPFSLSSNQSAKLEKLLQQNGLPANPDTLLKYISAAIFYREQAKFEFTRTVSDMLQAIEEWGFDLGLTRDDIAYLTIDEITGVSSDIAHLKSLIDAASTKHLLTSALKLPHLISGPDDIDVIRSLPDKPTFVTSQSVTAKTVLVQAGESVEIKDRIVLIESADPGYDWIFSHGIVGLITKYGGVNSHMAIRCAEFGLPAAIGCGDKLFEKTRNCKIVELNCNAHKVINR